MSIGSLDFNSIQSNEGNLDDLRDSCRKKLTMLIGTLQRDLSRASNDENWYQYTEVLRQLNKFKVLLNDIESLSAEELRDVVSLN